ncbi:GNAT family N-acetyltransferase [Anaeromicrobium sediminis]|uniref:N-acetyltransferase n=1 Tax=Anaeromicrobium sediminis TaxID=1478221 RepID=A0A267MLZ7_9FIRM|nr:GNAT family N-acetyltransferase [Anaeromicrobium sediminis]PAB60432.1 N-acetyltransferase [Anaeromicrobium sediminis]
MKFRDICEKDFKYISSLNEQLGYDLSESMVKERIKYILENTKDRIIVAEINNKVIGYIHGSPYELLYYDSVINIVGLVVDKNCRRLGVGKKLINEIELWARENNFKGIRLVSGWDRKGAHDFYEKCGFINRKDQKNFIKIF